MGKIVHHSSEWAVLYIRVPSWLKNRITSAAKKNKVSVNSWVANQLLKALEEQRGLPQAPDAIVAPPTPQQILEGYLVDRPPLEPCGVAYPCARQEAGEDELEGFVYCRACRIRVR